MSFSKMLELLKQKEKGIIIFIKLGTFYIATAEDAVLLHNKLELKCTCFKMNICKIGFPVNSLEKYVDKLSRKGYRKEIILLDDSICIFKTKEEAKIALERIRRYLEYDLELELNEKTQIFKSKQGVNFCGYKINEYRLKIRDRRKTKTKKESKRTKIPNTNRRIKGIYSFIVELFITGITVLY